MLKTLIKLRFLEILNQMQGGKKKNKKNNIFGVIALYIVVFLSVGFLFSQIFHSISVPYHIMGLDWLYFAFSGIVVFTVCFIGSIFLTQKQIYEANDNEILLAMPIKPIHIIFSRIISLLGLNYLYELAITAPALIVYFYDVGFNIGIFVLSALIFLFLPILSMTISVLFGWFVAWISSKVSRPKVLIVAFSMILMLGYFYLCFAWQGLMAEMAKSGAAVAEVFNKYLAVFYVYGMAIAETDILFILLFILISALPFALVCYFISKSFISIATRNKGGKKIVYREKKVKAKSIKFALISKECAMFIGSPTYILNAGAGLLFMPLICIYLMFGGDNLNNMINMLGMDLMGVFVCMGLGFSTGMITISSPTFSLEAKTLWILKSLPIKSNDIIFAKLMPHIIFSVPFIVLSGTIIQFAIDLNPVDRVMVYLIPITATIFNAMIGLFLGMCFPKFNWTNEAVAIKQATAPLLSLFIGLAIEGGTVALLFLLIRSEMFKVNQLTSVVLVLYLLFSLIMALIIKAKGETLVKNMQA